jgi:hypothetical protein
MAVAQNWCPNRATNFCLVVSKHPKINLQYIILSPMDKYQRINKPEHKKPNQTWESD